MNRDDFIKAGVDPFHILNVETSTFIYDMKRNCVPTEKDHEKFGIDNCVVKSCLCHKTLTEEQINQINNSKSGIAVYTHPSFYRFCFLDEDPEKPYITIP
jgi:hypothetical protein